MAEDKKPIVDDGVTRIENTLKSFLETFGARLEKVEGVIARSDAFHTHDGKPKSDGMSVGNLDQVLSHVDARLDAFAKRMDAFESKEPPKEEKKEDGVTVEVKGGGEGGEEKKEEKKPVPAEAEPAEMHADKKADAAGGGEAQTGDGGTDPKYLKPEREENNLKVNDAAARADAAEKAVTDLKAKLAAFEKSLEEKTAVLSDDDSAKFALAQTRANSVYHAFGDAAGAPRWARGEQYPSYLRRLLKPFKTHSKVWKDEDLALIPVTTLEKVAEQVYSDAMTASKTVGVVGEGNLLEIKEVQPVSGRTITKFVGDPEACWAPFKLPAKQLVGINTKS